MSKRLMFMVLALCACGAGYGFFAPDTAFGVSDKRPLGSFDRIDGWLLHRGFQKEQVEPTFDAYRPRVANARMFGYRDPMARRGDAPHDVWLLVDKSGNVRAIRAAYVSASRSEHAGSTRELFAHKIWVEVVGHAPVFTGSDAPGQRQVASERQGAVNCRWTKLSLGGTTAKRLRQRVDIYLP